VWVDVAGFFDHNKISPSNTSIGCEEKNATPLSAVNIHKKKSAAKSDSLNLQWQKQLFR
jgi:hypothetical protein